MTDADDDPWAGRLQAAAHFKHLFTYKHLPAALQEVSKPFADLAEQMLRHMPDGPELTAGLRKLLEAKDCFVRHYVLTGAVGAR